MPAYCPYSGKEQFATPAAAQVVRKQVTKRNGGQMFIYQCHVCRMWHLSSRRQIPRSEVLKRRKVLRELVALRNPERKEVDE